MAEKSDKAKGETRFDIEEDLSKVEVTDVLPVLPLRGIVIFPNQIHPFLVSRPASLRLIEDVGQASRVIGLSAQKNPEEENPGPEGLFPRGTAVRILKMLKYPDHSVRVLVQGIARIDLLDFVQLEPYFRANVRRLAESVEGDKELDALQAHLVSQFSKFVSLVPYLPDELQVMAMQVREPARLTDMVASYLKIAVEESQDLLSTNDVRARLEKLIVILGREIELLELGHKIQSQVQTELNKNQREYYLRQQLKAIQKELGEGDARSSEIEDLEKKIEAAKMPEDARKAADKELDRLKMIPPESAEHTVVRTYLDWLVSLPWAASTDDNLDIKHARAVLDEDHFDLEKVKERILEFLAVRKLKSDTKGPILCFVGPPGTGKTSLGRSIARALGRKFVRLSLGGIRDEAEIRGHRRTYIGSLPGRMIQGLRNAGSNNPLFILDEVDKLGTDFRGDPASALLEVLDPEQNNAFVDHYLDVPFDLSKVLFLTTANVLDPIPPALRDRMEVLELPGYTEEEKLQIAERHLVPKQISENGLGNIKIEFTKDAVSEIIRSYTREAGLRNLEREIGRVCRKIARALTEGETAPERITPDDAASLPRPAQILLGGGRAHPGTGRRHGSRVDAQRRRHPVHREHPDERAKRRHHHRLAGRRDEGVGAGGALICAIARGATRHRARLLRKIRSSYPRPGRRHSQGRPVRRRYHRGLARFAAERAPGALRRRDDRRDNAARQSPAGRRSQGESAGGAARGNQDRDPAAAKRKRPRGYPRRGAQRDGVRVRRHGRRGPAPRAPRRSRAASGSCAGARRAHGTKLAAPALGTREAALPSVSHHDG